MGPPETKKLLYSKGHGRQDKMTVYRMGKDLNKPHIRQRADLQNIYKELKKLVIKRTNNPIIKWVKDLNRDLSTEESKMVERQRNVQHP